MSNSQDVPQTRLRVPESVNEDDFFYFQGEGTLANHADLEETVPNSDKDSLVELERYWVNKPYAFIVIYRDKSRQEFRCFLVEPTLNDEERGVLGFFSDKIKNTVDYEQLTTEMGDSERANLIKDMVIDLCARYDLLPKSDSTEDIEGIRSKFLDTVLSGIQKLSKQSEDDPVMDSIPVETRSENSELTERQIEKMTYYLVRDFVEMGKIDGFSRDINIEDISLSGYNKPIFVNHTSYEEMVTNVTLSKQEADEFVIRLAQEAGKGISIRSPNIDATLRDGSRAQLTLGKEVSSAGTNFTIRQFKEVPFTPLDLISWNTFSIDQAVYIWLMIENQRNGIIAGGTASGKTTTLNALSLFIPSSQKIVSIEDTRELELPHQNWISSVTRDPFSEGDGSEIEEYKLVEDALRQRPTYIVMGEVRGEEGQTLFQAMNTGHTVFTTFHADSPDEVIKRFRNEPINVSPTLLTSTDFIMNQRRVTVDGSNARRLVRLDELESYSTNRDQFFSEPVYRWVSGEDRMENIVGTIPGTSAPNTPVITSIIEDRGWTEIDFRQEWRERKVVLSYLLANGINTYAGVAATLQAYMYNPEIVMRLIHDGQLESALGQLTGMKTIDVSVSPEQEDMVPRPTPPDSVLNDAQTFLDDAQSLLEQYDNEASASLRELGAETNIGDKGSFLEDDTDTGLEDEIEFDNTESTDEPSDDSDPLVSEMFSGGDEFGDGQRPESNAQDQSESSDVDWMEQPSGEPEEDSSLSEDEVDDALSELFPNDSDSNSQPEQNTAGSVDDSEQDSGTEIDEDTRKDAIDSQNESTGDGSLEAHSDEKETETGTETDGDTEFTLFPEGDDEMLSDDREEERTIEDSSVESDGGIETGSNEEQHPEDDTESGETKQGGE